MNNDHCCLLSFRPLYYFLECNLFEKRKALEDFLKVFSIIEMRFTKTWKVIHNKDLVLTS